jgi:hypothetical protein
VRLNEIADKYADQMQFVCIYIREAHPSDGDQVTRNLNDDVFYDQPTTEDERADVAAACMLRFNFSFPMLLDNMTDEAEETFISWPERLYIVDGGGRVTYKGGLGPVYFDVDEWVGAIEAQLGQAQAAE